jgi:uncharacterized delta-60 repeat protein
MVEGLEDRLLLSAGDLDTTFSGDGMATIAANKSLLGRAVAVKIDGTTLVAGGKAASGGADDFAVAALKPAGSTDTTFAGGTGLAVVSFDIPDLPSPTDDSARAITVRPDGKILMAGDAEVKRADSSITTDFAVTRLNANGTIDPTFGVQGKRTIDFALGSVFDIDVAYGMALQGDGKIVLVGMATGNTNAGAEDFAIARLNADGSLDTTFGNGGKKTIPFDRGGINADTAYAVAIQVDGKIIVAGESYGPSSDDFAVARLTATGALDLSFGVGGKKIIAFGDGGSTGARALALQPDGKIVLAGSGGDLARLNPDGSLDSTFGKGGLESVKPIGGRGLGNVIGVAIQPNGAIVAAGSINGASPSASEFIVARFHADGTVDTSFGAQGAGVTSFGGTDSSTANGMALHPDGAIVVVGTSFGSSETMRVARFLGGDVGTVNIPTPSAPTLDPGSDTDVVGDGRTRNARPTLIGKAQAGLIIDILDQHSQMVGTSTAAADGTYSVRVASPLAPGDYTFTARARDSANHTSSPSAPTPITILTPGIGPTLVVSVHGQYLDVNAVGQAVASFAVGGAYGLAGLLTYDAVNGIPATGSGRSLDPWQNDIGGLVADEIRSAYKDGTGGQSVVVKSLEVDWDTYGTEADPAAEVARRVNAIVADTPGGGEPWDVLFVGYSRGGPFVNEIMKHIDLANNPRIDYSEAILLDPTASKVSGDQFPDAIPDGLDREIDYDDGYAFPLSQLSFHVFGKEYDLALGTNDGNSGNRIGGAEYRYARSQITAYVNEQAKQGHGMGMTGNDAIDSRSAHSDVPDWWLYGDEKAFDADIKAFITAKDHGATASGGKVDVTLSTEVIQPASSAPNLKDPIRDLGNQLIRIGTDLANQALRLGKVLVKEAEQLAGQVTAKAQELANALIASAKNAGARVLAEARAQGQAILKQAKAEINKINAQAKQAAAKIAKDGKLFTKDAAKEVAKAAKALESVQKTSLKSVNAAEKEAAKKVAATKKKVGEALKKAQEEADAALAHAAELKRQADEALAKAGGQLATAANNAANAAQNAGAAVAGAYQAGQSNVGGKISDTKKKLHLPS